jgi:hypothetical protein
MKTDPLHYKRYRLTEKTIADLAYAMRVRGHSSWDEFLSKLLQNQTDNPNLKSQEELAREQREIRIELKELRIQRSLDREILEDLSKKSFDDVQREERALRLFERTSRLLETILALNEDVEEPRYRNLAQEMIQEARRRHAEKKEAGKKEEGPPDPLDKLRRRPYPQ